MPETPPAPPSSPAAPASDADRLRSRLMQASLKTLLDQVKGSRQVMPHLAALENALGRKGLAELETLSPKVLGKICSQLSSLPLPKDDKPLIDLLSRLLDLMEGYHLPQKFLSTFVSDSQLMVMEASHSDFMAAMREQAPTQHGEP